MAEAVYLEADLLLRGTKAVVIYYMICLSR
jgi:hypothetical protein